ncbi:MAG: OmpA family protein [Crocinitomicaceae bacterium]|nr:OmpA family protein [Crocinitomicaceae bacterium]
MKKILLIILSIILVSDAFAQNVEFDKKNFKEDKDGYKEAMKSMEEGDKLMASIPTPKFKQALPFYESAQKFNPNNDYLNFQIGLCHLYTNFKFKALQYFEKSYQLNPNLRTDIHYYIGKGHHLQANWNKAIQHYELHKKRLDQNSQLTEIMEMNKYIFECNSGKELVKKPVRVWIDNLGKSINSDAPEYGMIITADASVVYFTSRRPNTTGGNKDEFINEWFEDIYISQQTEKDKWSSSTNVGEPINTKGHDAAVALSPDGSKMIIYIDDKGDGNLYESTRKGEEWSKPKKMSDDICSPYHEPSAWYSSDMKLLYFVSDRPVSGKGAAKDKDIYLASWDEKKEEWTNVQPLPATVNSKFDEDGIYLHPDNKTLYFSSKGHNSMGGYDVFRTVRNDDGTWTTPENIGYPVNTVDDDVFFVVAANGRDAYMTSFREQGFGDKDLYKVTFLGPEKQPLLNTEDVLLAGSSVPMRSKVIEPAVEITRSQVAILKGIVRDDKTKEPLESNIELIDNELNKVIAEFKSDAKTGKFLVSLPGGKNYGIAVKADGYLFHSENFDVQQDSDYKEVEKIIDLKKVSVGQVIVLRNIFFDLNKFSLRPESQNELDRLTKLLTDNPTIRIEISGHTDTRGSDTYNKELSHNRAKAVVDYLIEKGIKKDRLEYMGYGEEKTIVSDSEIAKLRSSTAKEDAHQENRRTEFKILSN